MIYVLVLICDMRRFTRLMDVLVDIPRLTEVSDKEDIEAGSYKITLKAESEGNNEVQDTLQITITVEALYDIQFEHITTATQDHPLIVDANAVEFVAYISNPVG